MTMFEVRSLSPISEVEYQTIESALMETERGRLFLTEFARRNRMTETQALLAAICRLEQAVERARVPASEPRITLVR